MREQLRDRPARADGGLGGGLAGLDPAARRPPTPSSGPPAFLVVMAAAALVLYAFAGWRYLLSDGGALGVPDLARGCERVRAAGRGDGRYRLSAQLAPDLVGVAPADAGRLRRDRLQRATRGGRGAVQRSLPRPDLRRQARGERPVRRPGRLHRVLRGPRPARGVGDAQHLLRGGDPADRDRVRRPDRPVDRRRDHGHLGHARRSARPRRARGQRGRRASGRKRRASPHSTPTGRAFERRSTAARRWWAWWARKAVAPTR